LISITSPGTTSADGMVTCWPPRITRAVGDDKERRESIVFSAEYSWKKPTTF
jgi:hypothetical protein